MKTSYCVNLIMDNADPDHYCCGLLMYISKRDEALN